MGIGDTDEALAVIWLRDIPDQELTSFSLPVLKASPKHLKTLEKNYINDWCTTHHKAEVIGKIEFQAKFERGLDTEHLKAAKGNKGEGVKHVVSYPSLFFLSL
jgi:hypothetical protein